MELQDAKERKVCKRKRTQSKLAWSLPLDLTSEVLLRLPEKSVARFRCVSKLWLSITTDPYFINLFETWSSSLLLCFKEDDKMFVSSIPQHHQTLQNSKRSYSSSQVIDRYHMKFPECSDLPTDSVHGLICFQESGTLIVWNPSTKQFLTLPKPKKTWNHVNFFLGYDPKEGKHKVVCIPLGRSCDVCRVLTLGSAQESWRTVNVKHTQYADNHTSGRCIKGVIYYIANVYHHKGKRSGEWTYKCVLMSFDVRSEKFDMITLPSNTILWDPLITYEERLAFAKHTQENRITLCILEDAEKGKWSEKRFVAPCSHYDESSKCIFELKGMTHAGEFIYVSYWFRRSNYILFCDPVRNSFRRFELNGIADYKSMLNNGFGNRYKLHVLSNHFQSQMSL